MTLVRSAGRLVIRCDSCPTTFRNTAEESTRAEMLEAISAEGWKKIRKAGDWTHQCPDCARFSDRRLL